MKIKRFQIHDQKVFRSSEIKKIIKTVFAGENVKPDGALNLVLTDNPGIQALNLQYFNKDNATDVIAFPLNDSDIWGEVYVSIDQALIQAAEYEVTKRMEVARLIVHGILHLIGYTDKTSDGKKGMHDKEDLYLNQLKCLIDKGG